MYLKQIALTTSLLAPLVLIAPWATADEQHEHDMQHRQHGAHVHGIAALNLVLEGRQLLIELDSPAVNIIGFEHAPSSDADHAVLDKAVATLKDGNYLFQINPEAGCKMENAKVSSGLLDEKQHDHADDHDHEALEHESETHLDIEAAYQFECEQPDELKQLNVQLFNSFSGMETLKVQYVFENKQGSMELTASVAVLSF